MTRAQNLLLYVGMIGLGFGIGTIWTAAKTMTAAGKHPPLWALELQSVYSRFALIAAALVGVGFLGAFAIEFFLPELSGTVAEEQS